jgi:hypothetical protein
MTTTFGVFFTVFSTYIYTYTVYRLQFSTWLPLSLYTEEWRLLEVQAVHSLLSPLLPRREQ